MINNILEERLKLSTEEYLEILDTDLSELLLSLASNLDDYIHRQALLSDRYKKYGTIKVFNVNSYLFEILYDIKSERYTLDLDLCLMLDIAKICVPDKFELTISCNHSLEEIKKACYFICDLEYYKLSKIKLSYMASQLLYNYSTNTILKNGLTGYAGFVTCYRFNLLEDTLPNYDIGKCIRFELEYKLCDDANILISKLMDWFYGINIYTLVITIEVTEMDLFNVYRLFNTLYFKIDAIIKKKFHANSLYSVTIRHTISDMPLGRQYTYTTYNAFLLSYVVDMNTAIESYKHFMMIVKDRDINDSLQDDEFML